MKSLNFISDLEARKERRQIPKQWWSTSQTCRTTCKSCNVDRSVLTAENGKPTAPTPDPFDPKAPKAPDKTI